jgi:ATP-dependent helicase YprA (DUF1998 family)
MLGRRDILGAAETGSGKTLAFGIPILCRILEDKKWSTGRYNGDILIFAVRFTAGYAAGRASALEFGCIDVAEACYPS